MEPNDKPTNTDMDAYFKECVEIDTLHLDVHLKRIAADFAFWNERYTVAMRAEMMAELQLRNTLDALRIERREALSLDHGKVTESMVEAAVTTSHEYQRVKLASIDAEVEAARLKGRLEALRIKRDMLMQIASNVRMEMSGDAQVRAQHAGARAVRENT